MPTNIPTLSYELNTMIRKHREEKEYTQEEFAFLIGRPLDELVRNEDLTDTAAYDINQTNFYARILDKMPKEMFFRDSFDEPIINITAKKILKGGMVNFIGKGTSNGKSILIESYSLPEKTVYNFTAKDEAAVVDILHLWLLGGYFIDGVTGYQVYSDLLTKQTEKSIILPDSFRPILVANAITTLCSRRKKPKLLPQRKLPKTDEKWLLYKEDV